MLRLLIVLYALCGVQGKAFPSRYKRNYEAGYHYIPFEESIQLPAGYSPQNLPNYPDYIQTNGHDWSSYYRQPVPSQPIQDPYSNLNGHHKMKGKHTWHFIDQNNVPINEFRDGSHKLDSSVEAPNVVEVLVKKEFTDRHGDEYDIPIVVEALTRKSNMDYEDYEIPVIVDSLTIEENPINSEYDKNPVATDSSIKHQDVYEYKVKVSNLDLLPHKSKPSATYELGESVKIAPVLTRDTFEVPIKADTLSNKAKQTVSYDKYEPIKDAQFMSSNDFELPVMVDSHSEKGKPVNVKSAVSSMYEPIKEKPVKEKPVVAYGSSDYPFGFNSLIEKDLEHETPIIVEALIRKKNPTFHIEGEYETPVVVEALVRKHPPIYENEESNTKENKMPSKDSFYNHKEYVLTKEDIKNFGIPVVEALAFEQDIESSENLKQEDITFDETSSLNEPGMNRFNSLGEKNKQIEVESAASYYMFQPIKEKPIKEKPIKEKPIKEKTVVTYDASDYPFGFNSLNKEDHDHETPIVIEALTRKEKPAVHMKGEYEMPVVVEALVRKHSPVYENDQTNTKENKMPPKDLFHPHKEYILTKEDIKNFGIPIVEALAFEQEIERGETPKQEGITLDKVPGFSEAEMGDSFDESGDPGSAMDFHRSRSSRSFLPVNSNTFSKVTNIQEQERGKFKSCVTPKNETGNCMSFQLCSVSSAISNIDEVLRNVCIIDEIFIGVCCPEFPVETVRVDWEQLKPDTDRLNDEKSHISKECGRLPSMFTDRDPWPWMALLIARSSDKIFCGGALIADQYVLTAAHCTKSIPRNQILVRLGLPASENRPEPDFEVVEIKRHAGYNPKTKQNDIALLKLSRRVQFGDFRRVVCLAKDEDVGGSVGESASLLRWKETPGEIKDVESLSVISSRECQNRMQTTIADSILCTEPRTDETMCNADSGAPLIIAKDDKFEVIGILTWNRNDCDERFPTVFTRVSSYHRWIEKLAS